MTMKMCAVTMYRIVSLLKNVQYYGEQLEGSGRKMREWSSAEEIQK